MRGIERVLEKDIQLAAKWKHGWIPANAEAQAISRRAAEERRKRALAKQAVAKKRTPKPSPPKVINRESSALSARKVVGARADRKAAVFVPASSAQSHSLASRKTVGRK